MPHAVPEWSERGQRTAQDPPRSHLLVVPSADGGRSRSSRASCSGRKGSHGHGGQERWCASERVRGRRGGNEGGSAHPQPRCGPDEPHFRRRRVVVGRPGLTSVGAAPVGRTATVGRDCEGPPRSVKCLGEPRVTRRASLRRWAEATRGRSGSLGAGRRSRLPSRRCPPDRPASVTVRTSSSVARRGPGSPSSSGRSSRRSPSGRRPRTSPSSSWTSRVARPSDPVRTCPTSSGW